MGWTHHSTGVQIIRACCIIQGLLGNVGRPGGGILALRGHTSIQGSTDIPTLYNMLPTYLPQPNAFNPHATFEEFMKVETVPTGWWHNFPKYMVSLLRAWYGDAVGPHNDWGYDWVPKMIGDHSQQPMTLASVDGVMKGLFVLGQNPVVGSVNSDLVERGLSKLDWMVVRDFAMTETANFWEKGRLVQRGELSPEQIGTEIFFLPSAMAAEKDGTVTNTNRLVQWHDKVVEAPGDNRSDLWFMVHLGNLLKAMYADSTDPVDRPIQALTWDYPLRGERQEPDAGSRAARDQRLYLAREEADPELPGSEGRRQHGLRRLALYRRLSARGPQPVALAQAGRPARIGQPSRLGLRLAVQPARALQPRLGRSRRAAVVGAQEARLVERGRRRVDRPRYPRFRRGQAARISARTGASIRPAWTRSAATRPSS